MTDAFRRCTKSEPFIQDAAGGAPIPPVPVALNAAMACSEKRLLVVGGYSTTVGANVNQAAELDLVSKKWTNLGPQYFPEALSEGTMVCFEGNFYYFGGVHNDGSCSNKMWILDTNNGSVADLRTITWRVWKGDVMSPVPPPRRGHSAALAAYAQTKSSSTATGGTPLPAAPMEDAGFYIFGGFDGRENRLADLWKFTFSTQKWERKGTSSRLDPTPRDGAAFSFDHVQNRLWLFGGFSHSRTDELFYFDLSEDQWVEIPVALRPTKRHNLIAFQQGSYFVVCFGQDGKGILSGCCQFHCSDKKWTLFQFEGDDPEPRMYCSACQTPNLKKAFVLGGTTGKKNLTSFLELDLDRPDAPTNVKAGKK